ncbi:hypothetical protein LTR95_006945 [Oleoguttula sp. CCFEE 5521]
MPIICENRDRVFNTEEALQQHIRDSPAHLATFDCEECERVFNTEEALQQQIRDSRLHADDESIDGADRSFDMRHSLHREVSNLLQRYGLSFDFSPVDDPHEFLKEYDTSLMGSFSCTNSSCTKPRWTSKKIAITIRQRPGLRYNARQCESCGSTSRPELDRSYAQRVLYRLAKWSGIAVQDTPVSPDSFLYSALMDYDVRRNAVVTLLLHAKTNHKYPHLIFLKSRLALAPQRGSKRGRITLIFLGRCVH